MATRLAGQLPVSHDAEPVMEHCQHRPHRLGVAVVGDVQQARDISLLIHLPSTSN
jgi:hypothetical protein